MQPDPDKIAKYMEWATPHAPFRCSRHSYFALAVRGDAVLFPSYNGAPRGSVNCDEIGLCNKDLFDIPSAGKKGAISTGDQYCPAVHAEENVICAAARLGVALEGSVLIVNGRDPDGSTPYCVPCFGCAKLIRAVGFSYVAYNTSDKIIIVKPKDLEIITRIHSDIIELDHPWSGKEW